jgi:hypothetical protein
VASTKQRRDQHEDAQEHNQRREANAKLAKLAVDFETCKNGEPCQLKNGKGKYICDLSCRRCKKLCGLCVETLAGITKILNDLPLVSSKRATYMLGIRPGNGVDRYLAAERFIVGFEAALVKYSGNHCSGNFRWLAKKSRVASFSKWFLGRSEQYADRQYFNDSRSGIVGIGKGEVIESGKGGQLTPTDEKFLAWLADGESICAIVNGKEQTSAMAFLKRIRAAAERIRPVTYEMGMNWLMRQRNGRCRSAGGVLLKGDKFVTDAVDLLASPEVEAHDFVASSEQIQRAILSLSGIGAPDWLSRAAELAIDIDHHSWAISSRKNWDGIARQIAGDRDAGLFADRSSIDGRRVKLWIGKLLEYVTRSGPIYSQSSRAGAEEADIAGLLRINQPPEVELPEKTQLIAAPSVQIAV